MTTDTDKLIKALHGTCHSIRCLVTANDPGNPTVIIDMSERIGEGLTQLEAAIAEKGREIERCKNVYHNAWSVIHGHEREIVRLREKLTEANRKARAATEAQRNR